DESTSFTHSLAHHGDTLKRMPRPNRLGQNWLRLSEWRCMTAMQQTNVPRSCHPSATQWLRLFELPFGRNWLRLFEPGSTRLAVVYALPALPRKLRRHLRPWLTILVWRQSDVQIQFPQLIP